MLTRHGSSSSPDVLALHEADYLLGVRRPMDEIERLRAEGIEYNTLYRFRADSMPVAEFRALWAEHGAFLRAEAKRRGIPLPDPQEYALDQSRRAFWIYKQERTRC